MIICCKCHFYTESNIHLYVSGTVKPVCLPNFGVDLSAEQQAWITGWGALRSSGECLKYLPRLLSTYLSFLPVDYLLKCFGGHLLFKGLKYKLGDFAF